MINEVLKFGGTSVGQPERMQALPALIQSENRRIIVLSAIAGTTNALAAIAGYYAAGNKSEAIAGIKKLESEYVQFIAKLYANEKYLKKATQTINLHFEQLKGFANDLFTIHEERVILAQGELLSTTLFHLYLQEIGIKSVLLPALDFMRIDEEQEPEMAYIEEHLHKLVAAHPSVNLFITQGYICRNAYGEVDNLKRGGSDYSASLIGAALRVQEIQIWTDIDGMHNNDPRVVDKTQPIKELSFDEAAELAYFGAKILHPASVWPAQRFNIPVRLLNTMQPEAQGTTITDTAPSNSIKAVAAKDGITAIKIKSSRMLLAHGFLRAIFEIFERYKTPIDVITTSEVAVSLTIDNDEYLQEIIMDLEQFGSVDIDTNQSIVCVVGDFMADKNGVIYKVLEALKDIPVRMVSYGGSKNNVSMLINTGDKKTALQALNDNLFFKKPLTA